MRVRAIDGGTHTAEPSLKPAIWFEQEPASPNQWRLRLTLLLGSQDPAKPFAYEAEITVQGKVEIDEAFPQDRKEQLALVNGFSLLYSAAREMLLSVTVRSVYGAVTLPTVSFVRLVKEATQRKAPPQNPPATAS